MIHLHEEAARCLLCEHAPCGENIARAIRAIRFDNQQNAWRFWGDVTDERNGNGQANCKVELAKRRIMRFLTSNSCIFRFFVLSLRRFSCILSWKNNVLVTK